jgi:hypothetical protein
VPWASCLGPTELVQNKFWLTSLESRLPSGLRPPLLPPAISLEPNHILSVIFIDVNLVESHEGFCCGNVISIRDAVLILSSPNRTDRAWESPRATALSRCMGREVKEDLEFGVKDLQSLLKPFLACGLGGCVCQI